ncbi:MULTISPECIES: NlpC/P60 family protein [unclassified Shewanella]|uniref:NlpC/P60 family protein n=1 Tax=unclassified Shewanella TaxID=196818 RepID=UPI001BBC40A9|nr:MULTISPECIES: NlpC/P60 family protein [unclassified Shewanella]GIU14065.1 peptidase P60 [Shewanella sp. MBTL60-112-B1]GIU29947.1 peptidase P60 [Shewanella sp. MBTL60-112-B2]
MRFLTVLFFAVLLSACSSAPSQPVSAGKATSLSNTAEAKSQLIQVHQEWKGVPYRLGGMSKGGIDCSGFVLMTFKSRFGVQLPRTTAQQKELGKSVSKSQLRAGDLVFFKTGWSTRHVGIYISDSQFLHASTSQGVMISSLNNSYWKQKYWLSRRL